VVDGELVVLVSESGLMPLEGRLNSSLARFLTGKLTLPEIIAQVEGLLDPLEVIFGVDELRRQGCLAEDPQPEPSAELPIVTAEDRKRLEAISVRVRATGGLTAEPLAELLRDAGLRVVDGGDAEITIAVVDDYCSAEIEALHREAWLPVKPFGSVVWAGPLVRPGHEPSWDCLKTRIHDVRSAWGVPDSVHAPRPNAVTPERAWSVAAFAVTSILGSDQQACLLTVNPATLQSTTHAIPRPQISGRAEHVLHMRCSALVSPLTGIVHSVERLPTGEASRIEVWVARHNFVAKSIAARPGRSLGKGVTAAQARTSAVCEALERYSGIARGDEPVIRATYRALGDAALHPHTCLGFSERQYDRRDAWNRLAPRPLWIPERFAQDQEVDWVQARSLTDDGTYRYVAAAYCYYDYPAGDRPFCRADSNGNAAGSDHEDAALRGLLELVERDAVAIWWYTRARRPGVALHTAYSETMAREYAALRRDLNLLDLTTDLGIPVIAAISTEETSENVLMGFGAHPDPDTAATGAIAELNQALALQKWGRGGRTFTGELSDRSFLQPDRSRQTAEQVSFNGGNGLPACVDRLRERGLSVLVVDQTRDEIGLPVVKVIVPGLRHFRPRFAPGRLYDVPVRLGWIERPLREADLNPSHLLI